MTAEQDPDQTPGAAHRPDGPRMAVLEVRADDLPCRRAWENRHAFEADTGTAPTEHPGLQSPQVVGLHELEAAGEVGFGPVVDVAQALRQLPAGS